MSYLTGNIKASMSLVINTRQKHVVQPGISRSSLYLMQDLDVEEEDLSFSAQQGGGVSRIQLHLKYFEIVRAVSNLISGSTSSTVAQLLLLYDLDLRSEVAQDALRQNRGMEVLINLLEVDEPKCQAASLRVIAKLACNNKIRLYLTNLGVITPIVKLLKMPFIDVRTYGVKALAALCQIHKPARFFRKEGGIRILVDFMELTEAELFTTTDLLSDQQKEDVVLATYSASALRNIAKYPKNAEVIQKSGIIIVLRRILYTCHSELLMEAFQLMEELTPLESVRVAVETEGFIAPLLAGVGTQEAAGRAACAAVVAAICDKSQLARHIVRLLQGLPLLVDMVIQMSRETRNDERMLIGLTAAVAKLAQDMRNAKAMTEKGLVKGLLIIMDRYIRNSMVFSNVMEGLAECAKLKANRKVIGTAQTMQTVIMKLHDSDHRVLTTVAQCLGSCANDPEVAQIISDYDGMRMLFSVLQVDDAAVQATALWALRPIIKYAKDSAEDIRSFTGSLGIVVKLMESQNPYVLAQAASFVAEIAKDTENLTILSDRALVSALSRRVDVRDHQVQATVAEAIAEAANLPWNAHEFGMMGVVVAMRNYLDTHSLNVHIQAMKALATLTRNPFNSVVLHQCDGLRAVLLDIAGPNRELQKYAMQVVNNLRMVALAAENRGLEKDDLLAYASLLRGMTTQQPSLVTRPSPPTEDKKPAVKETKGSVLNTVSPPKRDKKCSVVNPDSSSKGDRKDNVLNPESSPKRGRKVSMGAQVW